MTNCIRKNHAYREDKDSAPLFGGALFFVFLFFRQILYLFDHRVSLEAKSFAILAKEAAKLAFMVAELFLAMGAGEALVGLLVKALGMQMRRQLPEEEKQKRNAEKPPREIMRNEDQGREHHRIIPVVNAAAATALILHKPGLERTEEEDTDHIADRIEEADEEENSIVDHREEIQCADRAVQKDPGKRHHPNGKRTALSALRALARNIVFRKLLLASHALKRGGKEAEDHFHKDNHADKADQDHQRGMLRKLRKNDPRSAGALYDIENQNAEKQSRSEIKLEIMQARNA